MKKFNNNLPWVELYRPTKLSNVLSQLTLMFLSLLYGVFRKGPPEAVIVIDLKPELFSLSK